ncbi:MAG: hypothetical protein M0P22_00010 [Methanoculleus sp.]|nr:hypothetical protein [Methanoculleus sp.]
MELFDSTSNCISCYFTSPKTTTPIENVTLLVPIPTRGDRPTLGHTQISDAFYADRLPDHNTPAIVPVDGCYYLRLTVPYMDPAEPIYVDYYNRTSFDQEFRPEFVPQLINTLHPFGNESLFSPKQNLTLTAGSPEAVRTSGYNPGGYSYSYTIPVYVYYENGSQVEIYSNIRGENEWVERFDAWALNRYTDHYRLVITGDPQGWMPAEGEVTAGQGVYREWQLAPSSTPSSGNKTDASV